MMYHNAKAISPVIKAVIVISTGSCRAQLLDCYLNMSKIAPKIAPMTCSRARPPTTIPETISGRKTMIKIIARTTIVVFIL